MIKFSKMGLVIGLAAIYAAMKAVSENKEGSVQIIKSNSNTESKICTYSDAIYGVYTNTEFDSTARELVSIIRAGGTSEYYEAIIAAVENAEFDSEKIEAVRIITKNYYKS